VRSTKPRPSRTPEEAAGYAVAHRVRVEVLSALNERSYSSAELARVVHQPLSTVTHHVEELLKSNCIEVAYTKKVRAIQQIFYRAIEMAFFTEEEMASWTFEKRQEFWGLVVQNATAEAMASLWAGKISDDPESWLTWRWFNVDARGRRDIMEEQERSFGRVQAIEAESNARRVESGEESRSIIVTSFGFERSRKASPPEPSADPNKT
jgi:Helix-turn-helix domain